MTKPTPDQDDILALASDFPSADPKAWLNLVEASLGGKPYDKLTSKTYDGLGIKPLYTAEDVTSEPGLPGQAPYTRGPSTEGNSKTGWDVRCLSSHPDPEEANRQILTDLEKGATSITLRLDPTGKTGTVVKSRADLQLLLKGVYLDLAPVVLDPGGPSLPPAAYLIDLLKHTDGGLETFAGNFGADPLSTLASAGKVIVPMETLLGRMSDLAAYISAHLPKARALNVSSEVYHSAGCSEAQEIGVTLATAVEYMRQMTVGDLSTQDASNQIAVTLTCDADIFLTIAKIRAFRTLWARVADVIGDNCAPSLPVYAVTAPRMMSRRDPWVNILRSTAACFGAGVAGAKAVTVLPYESALGLPTSFGRRIARNTQIILQEESFINRVVDPAGGSWTAEAITSDLAEAAWAYFQSIEGDGGIAATLISGRLAQDVDEVATARAANIARRKDALTGVSEFPNISEKPAKVDAPDLNAISTAADKRAEAAQEQVSDLPSHGGGALMEALVEAVSRNASTSAIGTELRGEPMSITPLPRRRLAEDFEALRDASEKHAETNGQLPKVFLANIGRVADFTARAMFAKNAFEAGGFETASGRGGTNVPEIAAAFKEASAKSAVICATDELYVDHAAELASALKNEGATQVFVAGRGGEHEDALRKAGVDGFVYLGCDLLSILSESQRTLGVAA